jgi:pimeloyl-ACP methyl ester carboxylesterase
MALTLHCLCPHRDVVVFNYRGYAPSTGTPSAKAVLSDSLMIFDRLQARASQNIIAVGFSLGTAIATYLVWHRPVRADSDHVELTSASGSYPQARK